MSESIRSKLEEALALKDNSVKVDTYNIGCADENARLQPMLKLLLDVVEAAEAYKNSSNSIEIDSTLSELEKALSALREGCE